MNIQNASKLLLIALVAMMSAPQIAFSSPQVVHDAKLKGEAKLLFERMVMLRMPTFYNGKISESSLSYFGLYYNYIYHHNRWKDVGTPDKERDIWIVRLPASQVNDTTQRYFGRTITHVSKNGFNYRNGYYYTNIFKTLGCLLQDSFVREMELQRHSNEQYVAYASCTDFGLFDENNPEDLIYLQKKRLDIKRVGTGANARFIVTGWSPAK